MMAFIRPRILALALLLAGPLPAFAHGAGWQIDQSQSATVYQFGYTDGTAMMFAEVTITGPDGKTWQKGRTDRTGRFAMGINPVRDQPDCQSGIHPDLVQAAAKTTINAGIKGQPRQRPCRFR